MSMMIISSLICPTAIQSEIIFTTPQKYFKFFVTSIFKILEILGINHRESSNLATDHRWPDVTKEVQKISCKIEPITDRLIIRRRSGSWLSVFNWIRVGLGPFSRILFWFLEKTVKTADWEQRLEYHSITKKLNTLVLNCIDLFVRIGTTIGPS